MTNDIGSRLRRARQQRGMSVGDLARQTKLTSTVLHLIERNHFAALPGGMFRKAYVRTVAIAVGLDPDELAADYCAQFEPPIEPAAAPDTRDALWQKLVEPLRPLPLRLIVTLAAVAAVAAMWFLFQSGRATPAPFAGATSKLAAGPMPVAFPDRAAADVTHRNAVATRKREAPLSIEIQATGWCWIAADADGERAIYRLVEPGEHLVLEAQHLLTLRFGDAGAVTVSINDGPRRSLGADGTVALLELTPENAEALRNVDATQSGN